DFNPAFPMFGTNEIAQVLTLKVKSPTQEFRRQLLSNKKDKQTDFKLGEQGAGPFGKRQKELLDKNLDIDYRFSDPLHVLPSEGRERMVLLTVAGEKGLTAVSTSLAREARVQKFDGGIGELAINFGNQPLNVK